MKLPVIVAAAVAGALATAASAQAPPAANPLDRTQQLGGWTVSDLGGKPGDDSDRQVKLTRSLEEVEFALYRSDADGVGLTIRFVRCGGFTVNSGFSLEGAVPARVAQVKDEIRDAFKDFAKHCPPKPGEEAALLEGFEAADALVETWIRARPFVYPPEEPAPPK